MTTESDAWSHLDAQGQARMVDVSSKAVTFREARAAARVRMRATTYQKITAGESPKGAVLAVARIAGIQGAKRTSELIPLCHPLPLDSIRVEFDWEARGDDAILVIQASTCATARTGVEMEALTAAAVTALTIYDMCKAVDRGMTVESLELLEKRGGKSGEWTKAGGSQSGSPRS